jgi:hypothetical protein
MSVVAVDLFFSDPELTLPTRLYVANNVTCRL